MTFFIDMRTIASFTSFTLPPITVTAQEVLGVFCLDFAHTLRTPVETGEKGGGGESSEEGLGRGWEMPSAGRAAVTAEYLQMALLTSQFSFCTTVSSNYKPTGSA